MAPYRFKTKPYAHQVRAIKFLAKNKGGALLMEPRTGKTKTTIDYLSMLAQAGKIDRAFIVCPARVMGVWLEEFGKHSPLRIHLTVWDKDARKEGDLPKPDPRMPYDLYVVIANYEAFSTPGARLPSGRRSSRTGRQKNRSRLRAWVDQSPAACVLDESHKIKNPSSKAATMLVRLAPLFTYRLILTGTPVTKAKRAHDIYMQWKFLNPRRFADFPTAQSFKLQYGRWITKNGYAQHVGARNMDQLKRRIHLDSFAVTRAQCFDLPPRDSQIVQVPLTTSARVYDAMADEMIAQLESGALAEAPIRLTQTLRLMQMTGGFVTTTDGEVERFGMEKLNALEEMLKKFIEDDQKVVICATFKADLEAIANLCRSLKMPTWELRGGIKRREGDEGIVKFREHEGVAAFVMQPSSGALGIDLSTSSFMVWYSLPTSWVNYSQACDRIALSRTSTTFYYLLVPSSVDTVIYDTLQGDGDVARAVLERPQQLRRK